MSGPRVGGHGLGVLVRAVVLAGAMVSVMAGVGGCQGAYVSRPRVSLDEDASSPVASKATSGAVDWRDRSGAGVPGVSGESVAAAGAVMPVVPWPAVLAVARVDEKSGGVVSLATREAEMPADFRQIESMRGVESMVLLNPLVVPPGTHDRVEMRRVAGELGADMLLLYAIRTGKSRDGVTIPGLGIASLGIIPNETSSVVCTAWAVLIDVRSGAVLGVAEASYDADQLSNAYTKSEAREIAQLRAERRAFQRLTEQLRKVWDGLASSRARER